MLIFNRVNAKIRQLIFVYISFNQEWPELI